jgi:hypothetical protein
MYEYGTLKSNEAILRRGNGKTKNNNKEKKPNQDTLYTNIKMSQQYPYSTITSY